MAGDAVPSGRERAIETLIDSEANGAYYRAARILDEVVPQALSNRPNLITRSALVEQAYGLAEYEIDSRSKYRETFGLKGRSTAPSQIETQPEPPLPPLSDEARERVLKHADKIVTIKAKIKNTAPSATVLLRNIFGSETALPTKAPATVRKSLFSSNASNEEDNATTSIEAIIGNVAKDAADFDADDDALNGLLSSILSVLGTLTAQEPEDEVEPDLTKGKSESRPPAEDKARPQDPTDMPTFQVGALMSLLHADKTTPDASATKTAPFWLDEKVIQYLADAASVYEERIEIQKAKLLVQRSEEDAKRQAEEAKDDPDGSTPQIPIVPLTPTEESSGPSSSHLNFLTDDNEDDDEEDEDDDEDDDDDDDDDVHIDLTGDSTALSAAVFDQIISAVAGDDGSLQGVDRAALRLAVGGLGDDSSDSESTNSDDNESDHMDRYAHVGGPQDEGHDSSSSDEDVDNGIHADQDEDGDHEDDDEDDDDDDEEENDNMLREALALSLAEHTSGFADADEEKAEESRRTPQPESDDADSTGPPKSSSDAVSIESQLPQLPKPPQSYPYFSAPDTVADVDDRKDPADTLHPCLDPASLSHFGSIPASFLVVRLLHNALGAISVRSTKDETSKPGEHGVTATSVPGGMGCTLIRADTPASKDSKSKQKKSESNTTASLQLLVGTLVSIAESRKEAIDGLREAVLAEQRNAQGEDEDGSRDDDNAANDDDTPLSDEEDEEETVAMTLSYARDNAMASSESLENKGMSRKAAAAGWDAAMRIKSLKKNTDAWKDRVKLYSYCTLMVMKCFRTFLQAALSRALEDAHDRFEDETKSGFLASLEKAVPDMIRAKLSETLSLFLCVSEHKSLPTLVSGDNQNEVEELFMPLSLYKEGILAWGECIPLFESTTTDKELMLRSMIKECFTNSSSLHDFGAFDTILSLPTTEEQSLIYKLDIVCRRFCVKDMLDELVSVPLCFDPDDSTEMEKDLPSAVSSLGSLLSSAAEKTSGTYLRYLRRLNIALCHRCNLSRILWQGFYAFSDLESEEAANLSSSPVQGNEALRVVTTPSTSLHFDSTKCSDSIAILSNHTNAPASSSGPSAHQRASKVWGTVMSASFFNPKSGVHRWAVRLDRCERGHVFVGVATSQASMRTYVGGDKYGWGVIGTQALWHDRRKIRGDYGATFRTGSIIVVTLDTDAGTLSFSTWKDTSASSGSFSLDPLSPSLSSPRRQGANGGTLEDWGIAFEGLPLDAKLYPSVGLYQRDDRVTLLPVESRGCAGGREGGADSDLFAGGIGYYPSLKASLNLNESYAYNAAQVRKYNDAFCWDAVDFVCCVLDNVMASINSGDENRRNMALQAILPSVASSVCLFPSSIPVLSSRFALHLLPRLANCITSLTKLERKESNLFPGALREGRWVIRATGSSASAASNEFEEYIVNFGLVKDGDGEQVGFSGSGIGTTGKSKNGLVSIIGTVIGSSVHFVEEWTDGAEEGGLRVEDSSSSCVVSARLSLDGFKLEGTYRNVQYGTTGHIAAFFSSDGPNCDTAMYQRNSVIRCQALLRQAHAHLAVIVGTDTAGDHASEILGDTDEENHLAALQSFLASAPLSEGAADDSAVVQQSLDVLRNTLETEERPSELLAGDLFRGDRVVTANSVPVLGLVEQRDEEMLAVTGGEGSLRSLCPIRYKEARLHLIASLIHHSELNVTLSAADKVEPLKHVWQAASTMIEGQLRASLSKNSPGVGNARDLSSDRCHQITKASDFLLSLQPSSEHLKDWSELTKMVSHFLSVVTIDSDLNFITEHFQAASRRACLRCIALQQVVSILPRQLDLVAIESSLIAIPRFLGRIGVPKQKHVAPKDLGCHYLSTINGAGYALRRRVRDMVHAILVALGGFLKEIASSAQSSASDSTLLALLPVFAHSLRLDDVEAVFAKSDILNSLNSLIAKHRFALRTDAVASITSETDKVVVVSHVREIVKRDLARAVLKTSLSVPHSLMYQVSSLADKESGDKRRRKAAEALSRCISFHINEFEQVLPFVNGLLESGVKVYLKRQGEEDYNRWINASFASSESEKSNKKRPSDKQVRSGLTHLLGIGTVVTPVAQTNMTKTGKGGVAASSSRAAFHDENVGSGSAWNVHVTRCLDALCGIVSSDAARSALVESSQWKQVLMEAIGLPGDSNDVSVSSAKKLVRLPPRHRARILRFLPTLLSISTPDETTIRGLFRLIGSTVDSQQEALNGSDVLVECEAVSALRQLYLPGSSWRGPIESVIAAISSSKDANTDTTLIDGVFAFVAGTIRTLGPGSFVLLKPSAAASLSPDVQSAPSSKSHGSSSSGSTSSTGISSHHVVGNGTEGIVAGLCRKEAAGGVVSSVDMKAGTCEIILVERKHKPLGIESAPAALTVRALRSPLADVAQAEKIPLVLNETFPVQELLENRFADAVGVFATLRDTSTGVERDPKLLEANTESNRALLAIRAAIVLLSDHTILNKFAQVEACSGAFSSLLSLAGRDSFENASDSTKVESLASLPVHEGKHNLFNRMLAEIKLRESTVQSTSHHDWETRMEDLRAQQVSKSNAKDNVKEGQTGGKSDFTFSSSSGGSSRTHDRVSRDTSTSAWSRPVSQSSVSSSSTMEDEESEAAATAAAHLREAAIAQMAELGLPRSWSELALRRTGGTNIEAAVHFCLERGGDMERLLADEREREQRQSSGSSRRRSTRDSQSSNHLLRQLVDMGFPSRWCVEALAATRNNVDDALTWILSNGERLSAEDEGVEDDEYGDDIDEDDDDEDDDDEEEDEDDDRSDSSPAPEGEHEGESKTEETEAPKPSGDASENESKEVSTDPSVQKTEPQGWCGSVTPLRFISGRSIINPRTLAVSGLPTGGFSSVGTKGVLLTSGKWYYEAILETAGCLQIGWADGSFSGHCHADRGDGCGDGPSSWAYDGWRRYRWHASATEWGCRWKESDVIGCLVDMDEKSVSFTLNGKGEEIGMGEAFSKQGFRPCGGVYACVSFNRKEKLRLILGGKGTEPFKFEPPAGYRGVGEAVLNAVTGRESLVMKESIVSTKVVTREGGDSTTRFLCDFSDGEHGHELFAWQHRYYGSDASVHLGSGRSSKQSSSSPKHATGSGSVEEATPLLSVTSRVEMEWSKTAKETEADDSTEDVAIQEKMLSGYTAVSAQLVKDVATESHKLAVLYCRKLVLHLVMTFGDKFDLTLFSSSGELDAACDFWNVIDICVSLRSAGWVGEAGAMAIAAEALGLGISSTDHQSRNQAGDRPGVSSIQAGNQNLALPVSGITQLLSSITMGCGHESDGSRETWQSIAACAEASIGADGGGGPLAFLQRGLQSGLAKSKMLRDVLVAVIRRSVRLLAVVDYAGDDSTSDSNEEDEIDASSASSKRNSESGVDDAFGSGAKKSESGIDEGAKVLQPDARLTCFLTGLLLSSPVMQSIDDRHTIFEDLIEAWSVGLLSASAPWRMVCAYTVAGILNMSPTSLGPSIQSCKTLMTFYGRLQNTVLRRVWTERAAVPVCSRYVQSLIELLAAVRRASRVQSSFPWKPIMVDAATPIPLDANPVINDILESSSCWEWEEGWVSNDAGWEIWTGSASCAPVGWTMPSQSPVRTLMDGGEGPPMLREGCTVMRGLDWGNSGSGSRSGDEDGKKIYESEKAEREKEKKALEEQAAADPAEAEPGDTSNDDNPETGGDDDHKSVSTSRTDETGSKKKRRKKIPNPKLATGVVLSIEPWHGIPAMARRVRWNLTGQEGIYRYGGDGGRFDICHVEVNEKSTRVRKRHPLPESTEQCAARHGFGSGKKYKILLRLRVQRPLEEAAHREGVLEWPDFGAGVRVKCVDHEDGSVTVTETELLFGSKDSGWEARFGQPSFRAGTILKLSASEESISRQKLAEIDTRSSFMSKYEELTGRTDYFASTLRHRIDGSKVAVTMKMSLLRGRRCAPTTPPALKIVTKPPPPMCFDTDFHASSMALSHDGRTLTCVAPDGRGTAFASTGFTKGVHYWEVKLEQADIGSVFIGVAEKPSGSGSSSGSSYGSEGSPRLNRWLGWGFVNFRATYTAGAERVYGAHCHNEDTVGVMLDCDSGRVSFFYDGLKYGEHILNDLGCAFENISPFGFNGDGCGSGGAGQGAPSGIEGGRGGRYPAHGVVRSRALWPVIGLRNPGDRVTLSSKWSSSFGVEGSTVLKNVLAVDELMASYDGDGIHTANKSMFPEWFMREAFTEYQRWHSNRWRRISTRGSGPHSMSSFGLDVDLDTSPVVCAAACASIGLNRTLLPGDRVVVKRSAGRPLELAEEAIVLGSHNCRLYYRLVSQKSEGGSLTEGGGRAWFWDESEVVDDSLKLVGKGRGHDIELPLIDRFRCRSSGGLKIVYQSGAVIRSDLEIIDSSSNLGLVPEDTVIPREDVLERRVNSCGVIRYRIRYESVGEGWISSRIRGGKEEAIVELVQESSGIESDELTYKTAYDAALKWLQEYEKHDESQTVSKAHAIADLDQFRDLVQSCRVGNNSIVESDGVIASLVNCITDFSEDGDSLECTFSDTVSTVEYAVATAKGERVDNEMIDAAATEVAAGILSLVSGEIPSTHAVLARMAVLRALNRRLRYALPWLSLRPSQEGTAILGGLCGHGASIERAGRNKLVDSMNLWVQVPSVASRVRSLRRVFFSSVKNKFLECVIHATTTPTPLSHDEYELPREIRTVRVNRLKARRAMAGTDLRLKRKHSVFSQLQSETRSWGGAALRRGFVAKGHGGQKRAFKVKLVGEGVNDYSGPYREVFTDAIHEVIDCDEQGHGVLGVLDPTPNNATQVGEARELFMFSSGERLVAQDVSFADISAEEVRIRSSFVSLTMARDESSREVEESLVFLGRVVGTACRHGIPVDLFLPMQSVWKSLAEERIAIADALQEVDELAYKQFDGDSPLLQWQQRMLNSFTDGLSHVLPVELLSLLTAEELRAMLCGNPDVDVDLLKRVVEYEGYDEESDEVIGYFWEVLREMSNADRKKLLQFVWARNRLPNKESDFDAPFKIQKDHGGNDESLPSASTCFFSLTLPNYSSKETLREKLMFALENVCTMESDYVTNNAEVSEGWRGL